MSQFPQYQDYVEAGGSAAYTNPTVRSAPTRPSATSAAPEPGAGAAFDPSGLGLRVSTTERQRAENFLAEAYADGRLSEWDFDYRLEQVLTATTRRDLNSAFYGLVQVPSTSRALGLHPVYRPTLVNHEADGRYGRTAAGLAHFSAFFTWIFGPLLFNLLSRPGSFARKESAKAFNFQLVAGVGFLGAGIVSAVADAGGAILAILWLAWVLFTVIGGVRAFQGESWRNPVTRALPLRVMDEQGGRPRE